MAKASVAILGGRGMLGTDLANICRQQGFETAVFDLPEFDVTNSAQLKQAVDSSELIINCAAYTDVDGAESHSDLAHAVNAKAVGELGEMVNKADKWVLHISTDFVFDGQLDRPYCETDEPNPIGEYGRSKFAGEQLLVASGCRHCIMRVQWTYGTNGKNFVTKLLELSNIRKEITVVDDQVGSPTATTEVAKAICELVEKKPQGLFHFAAEGYISRFEMAKFVFDKMNIAVDLKSCKSDDFKSPAKRPLNSRFCCDKIQSLLSEAIRPWQRPLEHFLESL
ncbi:MAG: dTDP-4-dehydrorhamnose reductase [Phycisphaerales bacterium]|jgi:dTDP-4-dehydrorhamnose reductase